MELPDDVLRIIKEYSMPISRPDWKKGCYFNRHPYKINNKLFTFKYLLKLCKRIHEGTIIDLYVNMIMTELILLMDEQ